MLKRLLFSVLLLAFPLTASAVEKIEWSFENNTPGRWEMKNISEAVPSQEGLYIRTNTDGYMTTDIEFQRSIEAVELTFQTNQSMEMVLLWKDPELANDGYVQLPLIIDGNRDVQTIDISLSTFNYWNSRATEFGIAFPAGATILLKEVSFYNWNAFEKLWHGFLSFWKFDTFTSHSINFMWGTWLTFNPIARADMHIKDPPLGNSGMWIFYIALALWGMWCLWKRARSGARSATAMFLIFFACLWLIYDLRMGTELLSYVRNDWRDFITKEVGERSFRSHLSFPDVAAQSMPYIANEPYYIFLGPSDTTVYFSTMRYLTYPNLPISSGDKVNQVKYAITFGRNSEIDENGNLVVDAEIVRSGSGSLLRRFDKYGSIYQFK